VHAVSQGEVGKMLIPYDPVQSDRGITDAMRVTVRL
jgi:hypothetical protein